MAEETVTISKKEYDSLLDDSKFLEALQDMGVDNWQGYNDAYLIYAGELDPNDI